MVANGFITIFNCIDWFRSRKLTPGDMILSCLGLFRFAFHAVLMLFAMFDLFFMDTLKSSHILQAALSVSWVFSNTTNLWFATWLSVLYCVKIATFTHPLFLQMKRRFPELVPRLLLGTVVFTSVLTVVTNTSDRIMHTCNLYQLFPSNSSDLEIKMPDSCKYIFFLYAIPNYFPFMIFLASSILLLTSLWRHKNLLQNSTIGTSDLNTEAHLNAIKALASFSILFVSSFLAEILEAIMRGTESNTWTSIISFCVVAAYSSGHAIILILINPKLKQESIRLLHQLKC
ncbi:taste receptor type 2 member 41-like [Rhineura floridana]|uniref:taste receptor type 2 member 41-like n=1 Tax=Rhineura floridana TaxID=261503 RepID=UPI002AC86791|nr:taste receptor type 2 member 41-like [Rhineura floridana]